MRRHNRHHSKKKDKKSKKGRSHHEEKRNKNISRPWSNAYTVVKVVTIGVTAAIAPSILGSVGIPYSLPAKTVITGLSCALTDAVMQKLGAQIKYQNEFSINEVLETCISASMSVALGATGTLGKAISASLGDAITQAVEIQLGTRKRLNSLAIAMDGATSLVSSALKSVMPYINQSIQKAAPKIILNRVGQNNICLVTEGFVDATANSMLDSVVGNDPLNPTDVAMHAVENICGNKIGDALQNRLGIHEVGEFEIAGNISQIESCDDLLNKLKVSKALNDVGIFKTNNMSHFFENNVTNKLRCS